MKEGIVYCSATTGRLRVMRDGRNVKGFFSPISARLIRGCNLKEPSVDCLSR